MFRTNRNITDFFRPFALAKRKIPDDEDQSANPTAIAASASYLIVDELVAPRGSRDMANI